jgi:ATP-dependent Clp protease ATP-binding subunit ClpB
MTADVGSEQNQELAGDENYAAIKTAVLETVGQHFRPEFLNRIDDMVVFHPLTQTPIGAIIEIQLQYLARRLAARDMRLELAAPAVAKLAEAGYDPVYGARPLKRAIQQRIENPLADEILRGSLAPGDTVTVTVEDDMIVIRTGKLAAA